MQLQKAASPQRRCSLVSKAAQHRKTTLRAVLRLDACASRKTDTHANLSDRFDGGAPKPGLGGRKGWQSSQGFPWFVVFTALQHMGSCQPYLPFAACGLDSLWVSPPDYRSPGGERDQLVGPLKASSGGPQGAVGLVLGGPGLFLMLVFCTFFGSTL